jgi:rieske iron-sulfur protein
VAGRGEKRREFLKGALALGAVLAGVRPETALAGGRQDDAAKARPREGDFLVRVDDPGLTPLTAEVVPTSGAPLLAWAVDPDSKVVRNGSKFNEVVLIRIEESRLSAETAPLAAAGVVAYAATCTHSGCEVNEWLDADRALHCACHSSKFDPANGARVIDGPAPRGLPALPLKLVGQALVVAGSFTTRVGFEEA